MKVKYYFFLSSASIISSVSISLSFRQKNKTQFPGCLSLCFIIFSEKQFLINLVVIAGVRLTTVVSYKVTACHNHTMSVPLLIFLLRINVSLSQREHMRCNLHFHSLAFCYRLYVHWALVTPRVLSLGLVFFSSPCPFPF